MKNTFILDENISVVIPDTWKIVWNKDVNNIYTIRIAEDREDNLILFAK